MSKDARQKNRPLSANTIASKTNLQSLSDKLTSSKQKHIPKEKEIGI